MTRKPTKRTVKEWTLPEIKNAIRTVFKQCCHKDDWDVDVIYEDILLKYLPSALRATVAGRKTKKRK